MTSITAEELEKIKSDFYKVVRHSQGIESHVPLDYSKLFTDWLENKQRIINLFDGKLIWESPEPISVKLNKQEKEKEFSRFLTMAYEWDQNFYNFIALNEMGFYANEVVTTDFNTPSEVKPGMKLLRAFKYFINDKNSLREWQDYASELIQRDKFEGTLCLSVHPLDFLSLSENTSGWRSCHALDGEYCAGNLSYMADSVTFVCYIKNKEETCPPNFPPDVPWNNKKWRMLMHLGNCLWLNRQYPFENWDIVHLIYDTKPFRRLHLGTPDRSRFTKVVKMPNFSNTWQTIAPNTVDYSLGENHILIPGKNGLNLTALSHIIKTNGLQYNDLVRSPHFTPACSKIDWSLFALIPKEELKITIGAPVNCPVCGRPLDAHHSLLCSECTENYAWIHYCNHCDTRLHPDTFYTDDNGNRYCEHCWHEHYGE